MKYNVYIKAITTIGFSILFMLICSSCNQEEIRPKEYPRIQTLEVSEITSEGATFKAKILLQGDQEIIEYGFVWVKEGQKPALTNAEQISIKETLNANEFTIHISHALDKNINYNVKAYAKTKDFLIYGSGISFMSLGSMAPVITGFAPKNGDIGDTLTIFGKNFSSMEQNIIASLGGVKAIIITSKHDTLKIIVPDIIRSLYSEIAITVLGNIAEADEAFKINPPEITSFDPLEAIKSTRITIKGKNFCSGPPEVFFGEYKGLDVTLISKNEIKVYFPGIPEPGYFDVKVSVFDQQVVANEKIYNKSLLITDFYPKEGTWGSTITIKLRNYDKNATTTVYFDDNYASITLISDSLIEVTVPSNLLTKESKIRIKMDNQTFTGPENFTLFSPKIIDFNPKSGSPGTLVTFDVENIHPYAQWNMLYIDNTSSPLVYNEKNLSTIKAIIPKDFLGDSRIKLKIGDNYCLTDSLFKYVEPEFYDFSPDFGSLYSPITITGKGFSPIKEYNSIFLDNKKCDIISKTDSTITFSIPENINFQEKEIVVVVGEKAITSVKKLKFTWYQINDNTDIPSRLPEGFIINDNIYFGIGFKYNITSNTVSKLNTNTDTPIIYGVSFAYANEGYVGLGINEITKEYNNKIWKYEPNSDKWSLITTFPLSGLYSPSFFIIDHFLYVGLGKTNTGYNNRFWKYDIINNSWKEISRFPSDARIGAAVFVQANKGYIGFGQNGNVFFPDFWEYNTENDSWSKIASPITNYLRSYVATFSINNESYLIGGIAQIGGTLNQVLSFNANQNKWTVKSNFGGFTRLSLGFNYEGKGYVLSDYYTEGIWIYNPELEPISSKIFKPESTNKQSLK